LQVQGVFITGTDTGVGKTVVAATLAWSLARRGIAFNYIKPVETGIPDRSTLENLSDAARVKRAGRLADSLDEIVPFTFPEPLAPLLAARRQGRVLKRSTLLDEVRKRIGPHRLALVEGAGGLLAPLCPGCLVIDLIAELGLPVLVVSRTGLGAVNHSLLTLRQLEREGIEILGLVANHCRPEPGIAEREFVSQLKEFADVEIFGELPYLAAPPENDHDWERLASGLDLASLLARAGR
jgi:dethiobiotin synthetase